MEVVDPRQTWIGPEVDPSRVCEGVVIHPGCRLTGAKTFLGPHAVIGAEGPVVLRDAVLGAHARADCGYLEGAVLLDGARAGWGAHFRPGTLLEEEASTAHGVGLKQTILLSFVTLGSLINFCDCLMAGGTSRSDHSEVGSGFIHFNFTPWGRKGDKATPSLVGDVVEGVFLRSPRIFLGGSGGMVGPVSVGYGAISGAGHVIRAPIDANVLQVAPPPRLRMPTSPQRVDRVEPRSTRNLEYIAQLVALRCWYRQVRRPRIPDGSPEGVVVDAGIELLGDCIAERVQRWSSFLKERDATVPELALDPQHPCPLEVTPSAEPHVAWVQGLSPEAVGEGVRWLNRVVRDVLESAATTGRS